MPLPRRKTTLTSSPGTAPAPAPTVAPVAGWMRPRANEAVGTRVTRRALGISSIFVQGLRTADAVSVPSGNGGGGGGGNLGRALVLNLDQLNSRFVEYIEKVRALEQLNRELETEIRDCLDRRGSAHSSCSSLRQDWEQLYCQVSDVILDNARLMLQTENTQATGEDFKVRYENEQPFRQAVEEEISSLYKVMDDAKIAKLELESQIEHMKEDAAYLAKNHEQDVKGLYLQLADSHMEETETPMETSLDHVLEAVRTHWEKTIEKNRAETDSWFDNKSEVVTAKLSQEEEAVEALRAEFNDVGSKVQSLQAETESLRALKRGLENSLNDTKHWYQIELQNLGAVISKLKAELSEIHSDVEQQQDDYETIINNKMRLEMEIGAYHGLLEGEESRLSSPAVSSLGGLDFGSPAMTEQSEASTAAPVRGTSQ